MNLPLSRISADQPLLLYDGDCGVCNWCVRMVLRHQPGGDIRFAALESPLGQQITSEVATDSDSIVWVSAAPRRVLIESSAVLAVLDHIGGVLQIFRILRLLPRPLRDGAYRLIARNRHRLGGRSITCVVPTGEERERFVDLPPPPVAQSP